MIDMIRYNSYKVNNFDDAIIKLVELFPYGVNIIGQFDYDISFLGERYKHIETFGYITHISDVVNLVNDEQRDELYKAIDYCDIDEAINFNFIDDKFKEGIMNAISGMFPLAKNVFRKDVVLLYSKEYALNNSNTYWKLRWYYEPKSLTKITF